MTTKPKEHSYPCIVGNQNGRSLYMFFASAKDIYSFVSVNQKEEDEDKGYQRVASPARTASISKFVDNGNSIPLSLLITLEKRAATFDGNEIKIKGGKKSGWVIDGQHRLIGSMLAQTEILLPVVAFIGLSIDEQIQQFVTVNREAKGVPTSLYYSLLKKLPARMSPADMAKERAADIAIALRNDESSPFSSRIVSTTSPKNGQLSLVNFVRKLAPLVREDSGLLGTYSLEDQIKVIDNFYQAMKNVFPKEFQSTNPIFFQTIGFGALFNFFPTLFSASLKDKQSFAVADVTEVLGAISHIDVSKWKGSTGSAAEIAVGKDLTEEFRQYSSTSPGSHVLKLS